MWIGELVLDVIGWNEKGRTPSSIEIIVDFHGFGGVGTEIDDVNVCVCVGACVCY